MVSSHNRFGMDSRMLILRGRPGAMYCNNWAFNLFFTTYISPNSCGYLFQEWGFQRWSCRRALIFFTSTFSTHRNGGIILTTVCHEFCLVLLVPFSYVPVIYCFVIQPIIRSQKCWITAMAAPRNNFTAICNATTSPDKWNRNEVRSYFNLHTGVWVYINNTFFGP